MSSHSPYNRWSLICARRICASWRWIGRRIKPSTSEFKPPAPVKTSTCITHWRAARQNDFSVVQLHRKYVEYHQFVKLYAAGTTYEIKGGSHTSTWTWTTRDCTLRLNLDLWVDTFSSSKSKVHGVVSINVTATIGIGCDIVMLVRWTKAFDGQQPF